MVKNPSANIGDVGSIPEWGRSPREGNGNPLQYFCLENSMDRGAWWAPVHWVAQRRCDWSDLACMRAGMFQCYFSYLAHPLLPSLCSQVCSLCLGLHCCSANRFISTIFLDSIYRHSVQFSSVAQSCPTRCEPMNCSMPGLPVHHHLLEFTQTHVHRVNDAIQPSHPLSFPSLPAPNPSQHQHLFQWVNSLHEVAKVLEFELQHQSFQWTPRADLL